MTPSQQSIGLLAEAFRKGLSLGLVSKAEVVKWADEIIVNEFEPDYFFIELSLAKNSNEVVEVLNSATQPADSCIPFRVMLGLIYRKLNDGDLNLVEASLLLDTINGKTMDIITDYERGYLYEFDDAVQWMYKNDDKEKLWLKALEFLRRYRDFNLDNYDEWEGINEKIEASF